VDILDSVDGAYEFKGLPNEHEGREGKNGSNGLMLRLADDERCGYIEFVVHKF